MVNMNSWIFFQILKTRLRVFSAKIEFWLEEQIWQKLYSEANIGTQVFFLNIDISWKYITKNENIYMHMLASHFTHVRKKKHSQSWPYFDRNYKN